MDFSHFTAGKDDDGRRIDKVLRRFLAEKNLSEIYKSLRKGLVKLNGKKCAPDAKVSENDDIQIADFLISDIKCSLINQNQNSSKNQKTPKPLDSKIIIFKNEDLLILNKPYDISVQGGNGKTSLSDFVQSDYDFYHQKKGSLSFKCGPLHRLDRKTSGILVFSQSLKGARWFSSAIKNHRTRKIYLGICEGNLAEKQEWKEELIDNGELTIDKYQRSDFRTVKVLKKSDFDKLKHRDSKIAVTHAFPISHGKFFGKKITLVKFEIETGRKHQIRAQSAFHGFPLLGDVAYGGGKIDSQKFGRDFFLHAWELDFSKTSHAEFISASNSSGNSGKSTIENLPKKIVCEIPEDFKNFLSFCLKNENSGVKI